MSLVEVLTAVGILSVAMLALVAMISNLTKSQATITGKNEANIFMSTMASYLISEQGCQNSLVNPNLLVPTAVPLPFTLIGYDGFGATGGNIATGTQLTPRLKVVEMTIRDKGIPGIMVVKNSQPHMRTIAQIKIKLQATAAGGDMALRERFVEIPVLQKVGALGKIKACNVDIDLEDACNAAGGSYSGGACTPGVTCTFKRMAYGCWPYAACPKTSYPDAIKFTKTSAGSIPAGVCPGTSTPSSTGLVNYSYSAAPCGKGGCTKYNNTAYFYICLKCQ